jgi:hypothetical protein
VGEENPGSGQISLTGQPHVDHLPVLVDRAMQIRPSPGHLDVCLVDEPSVAGYVPPRPRCRDELGREPLHPPVNRDVVDVHAALGEQLLHVAIRQPLPQIPPHR